MTTKMTQVGSGSVISWLLLDTDTSFRITDQGSESERYLRIDNTGWGVGTYRDRSRDSVALRSPCVRAPRDSSRLATILANLNTKGLSSISHWWEKLESYSFVTWVLYDFLFMKNDVPSKSSKQQNLEKSYCLLVTDEKSRIRIRTKLSRNRNTTNNKYRKLEFHTCGYWTARKNSSEIFQKKQNTPKGISSPLLKHMVNSVADPDPDPFWSLDTGWIKNQDLDPDPWWTSRITFPTG